ncbi:MAG: hypothetical protein ACFKPT_10375 [Gloeotrichia echinulata GP01]
MNEQRQAAYQELVNKLILCLDTDSIDRVLAAQPELVDIGLVQKILDISGKMNSTDIREAMQQSILLVIGHLVAIKLGIKLFKNANFVDPTKNEEIFELVFKSLEGES